MPYAGFIEPRDYRLDLPKIGKPKRNKNRSKMARNSRRQNRR